MKYIDNAVTLDLQEESCTGCGMCVTVCPRGVFVIEAGKACIVDRDLCIECGACEKNCPSGAVTVRAGVGCANAILKGMTGGDVSCGCCDSSSGKSSCC